MTTAVKPTTPTDAVLPGGHRMHSMDEPMAKSPVELKDTPVPSTTPEALQEGGDAQGKSVPTPEPATDPVKVGTETNVEKEFKLDVIDNPVEPKATVAKETKTHATPGSGDVGKGSAGTVAGPTKAPARRATRARVSSPKHGGHPTRK